MPSLSRPRLVGSLAEQVASVGRLPFLGTLGHTGHHGAHRAHRSNSAQRLQTLSAAFTVPEELADALAAAPHGPVLLVDDYTDSGWTLAVAARLLRQAGAEQVLPLVLAVTA